MNFDKEILIQKMLEYIATLPDNDTDEWYASSRHSATIELDNFLLWLCGIENAIYYGGEEAAKVAAKEWREQQEERLRKSSEPTRLELLAARSKVN